MDRLSVYSELAECYDRLGQISMRDRFLILAADAALEAGQPGEAERMRLRLLQGSRHHMLRPYQSFAEAARAPDVRTYVTDLRTNYPPSVAQQLLDSLKSGSGDGTPDDAAFDLNQSLPEPKDWAKSANEPPLARPIPPTAPLIDLASRQRGAPIGGSPPTEPGEPATYPIREDPAARPLAPPMSTRGQQARPLGETDPPSPGRWQDRSARPTAAVPRTLPAVPRVPAATAPLARTREAPRSLAPLRPVPNPAAPERETPPEGGVWFIMLLLGVVCAAGLALFVFTFARPFLPGGWLP